MVNGYRNESGEFIVETKYFNSYDEFFKNHVIEKNQCKWGVGWKSEEEKATRSIASWTCLINGHNVFEDYLDKYPKLRSATETKKGRNHGNEGDKLLKYIQERSGDVIYSIENNTSLDWLQDYIFDDLEKRELMGV